MRQSSHHCGSPPIQSKSRNKALDTSDTACLSNIQINIKNTKVKEIKRKTKKKKILAKTIMILIKCSDNLDELHLDFIMNQIFELFPR